MAILFADEYEKCSCGSTEFLEQPVTRFKKTNGKENTHKREQSSTKICCAKCNKVLKIDLKKVTD